MTDYPEWLKVDEVAAALRISRGLVYELAKSGALPARKFGRLLRIHRSVLEAQPRTETAND